MKKHIIFDFDGVIHDTTNEIYKIHYNILEKITKEEMFSNVFNKNPREYLKKFSLERIAKFEKAWEEHYKTLSINPTIKKELEFLSKKYNLYIISSNNEYNLDFYLKKNRISNLFKDVYGSETHNLKYDKFEILFKKYNLNLSNTIFVTDTLGYLIEANKFGLKCIAVDFGFHSREKLINGNPIKIISDFKEIRKFIPKF